MFKLKVAKLFWTTLYSTHYSPALLDSSPASGLDEGAGEEMLDGIKDRRLRIRSEFLENSEAIGLESPIDNEIP